MKIYVLAYDDGVCSSVDSRWTTWERAHERYIELSKVCGYWLIVEEEVRV